MPASSEGNKRRGLLFGAFMGEKDDASRFIPADAGLKEADVGARVERVGENGVADGLLITRDGRRMIITALEENALKVRDLTAPGDEPPRILVQDERLR